MTRFRKPLILLDLCLADLGGCLRFFSRLPIPPLSPADDPAALPNVRRAAALVPAAGLVIALPAAVAAALSAAAGLPPLVTAGIAMGVNALATGALHEDGLADTADGLFGGADPARRLEIMRDSRIGSYGALSLVITGLVKAGAIADLALAGPAALAGALLAAAAVSRGAMVVAWHRVPAARRDGLSASVGQPARAASHVAVILSLFAAALALWAASPVGLAAGLAAAGVAAALTARAALARIGGQTGDVLGAVQQGAETAFLAGLLI